MKNVLNWQWDHSDEALTFIAFVGLLLVVTFQMTARFADEPGDWKNPVWRNYDGVIAEW